MQYWNETGACSGCKREAGAVQEVSAEEERGEDEGRGAVQRAGGDDQADASPSANPGCRLPPQRPAAADAALLP